MKKIFIGVTLVVLAMTMVGCDENKETNVEINSTTHYIDTTESIKVKTFNGYRLKNVEKTENTDGSIKIILEIDDIFK